MKLKSFKDNWGAYIGASVWIFIMVFLVMYMAKVGMSSIVLPPTSKWNILFNISLWAVMMVTALKYFYEEYDKLIKEEKYEIVE